MSVSVHLVTWNGARYLPQLFASLRHQTFTDSTLHVLDNGSTDGTQEILAYELPRLRIPFTLDQEKENRGFVGGHNVLYTHYAPDEFLVLLNQDMQLEPDCLFKMVAFMEQHPKAAVCTPRLMRWDPGLGEKEKTDRIDTLGLRLYESGRVMDAMSGLAWSDEVFADLPHASVEYREGVLTRFVEVFGVSGALPCFRASVIAGLPGAEGIFDPDFFSYKEDVDLAFRLQKMGWRAYLLPDAVAYHDRTSAAPENKGDQAAVTHWSHKSALIRNYSYRNQWFLILKHMPCTVFTAWFELKKFLYLLVKDMSVIRFAVRDMSLHKKMWRKRRVLRRAQKTHDITIRRWMM